MPGDERAECSAISGACVGDEFRVRWFASVVMVDELPPRTSRRPAKVPRPQSNTMRRVLIVIAVTALVFQVDTTIDISMHSDGSGTITLTAIADSSPRLPGSPRTSGSTPRSDGRRPDQHIGRGLQVELTHDFANPAHGATPIDQRFWPLQFHPDPSTPMASISWITAHRRTGRRLRRPGRARRDR